MDLIPERLRLHHDVAGGVGCVLEYYGPGLKCLSAMDRPTIANRGTELGAISSVFPSGDEVRRFLKVQHRDDKWVELLADGDGDGNWAREMKLKSVKTNGSGFAPQIRRRTQHGHDRHS